MKGYYLLYAYSVAWVLVAMFWADSTYSATMFGMMAGMLAVAGMVEHGKNLQAEVLPKPKKNKL